MVWLQMGALTAAVVAVGMVAWLLFGASTSFVSGVFLTVSAISLFTGAWVWIMLAPVNVLSEWILWPFGVSVCYY